MNEEPTIETPEPETWTLLRDVAVLQVKLLVDGLRDLVLVPASLVAGLVSFLNRSEGRPGPQFYRLLAAGKESERLINLFGAVNNSPEGNSQHQFGDMDIDGLVNQVEQYVIDDYNRGGVTTHAKDQIGKALAAIQRRAAKRKD
jgi:hypothetical protein